MLEYLNENHTTRFVDEKGFKFTLYDLENEIKNRISDIFKVIDLNRLLVNCSLYCSPVSLEMYIKCVFRYNGETCSSVIAFDDILDKEHLINQIMRDIAKAFRIDNEPKVTDNKKYTFSFIDGMEHDELVELIKYAVRRL